MKYFSLFCLFLLLLLKIFAGTHTTRALEYVTDDVFGTRGNFSGNRKNETTRNLVIFLTDGVSTDGTPTKNVTSESRRLHVVTHTVSV